MAVNDLITFRKGTASQWISVNPVLASGEPGYDLTNNILKIGDGSKTWNQLSSISSENVGGLGATEIYEYTDTSSFPQTGSTGIIYIATDASRLYRWNGSSYNEVGSVGGDLLLWEYFKPPAPTNLSVSAGNAVAQLSWTAPSVLSQVSITDYVVQYSTNSGTTWTTFTDGTSTANSATITNLINGTSYIFRIAAINAVGQGAWSTNSSSVVPGADPLFGSVSLLLHGDGNLTDSSANNVEITASGSVTYSNNQSKWGGSSIYIPGLIESRLRVPIGVVPSGTSDFTIEAWIYPQSWANNGALILQTALNGIQIGKYGDSASYWGIAQAGVSWLINDVPLTALNTWSHIAVVRQSNSIKIYINGTQAGSTYTGNVSFGSFAASIGGDGSGASFQGYIDDFRITNTARYTGTFAPPASAFADYSTLIAPGAPTSLSATPNDSSVSLSWLAPSINGGPAITDYIVQYSSDNGSNWTTFSDGTSFTRSATVTGLNNNTSYVFRVAAVNSVGISSYSNSITSTPIVPSVLTITSQPENNFSATSTDNATFSVSASLTNGTISYQWQYYGYDTNTYNYGWQNAPGQTSNTLSISPSAVSSAAWGIDLYQVDVQLRCIVTGSNNAGSLTSSVVRWIQYSQVAADVYWYGDNGAYNTGSTLVNGNYYNIYQPSSGENMIAECYDYYGGMDSSWYSSNAFTVKVQVSDNASTWTDISTTNFRTNGFYNIATINSQPAGQKYYRQILVFNWPFTVTNGTSSSSKTAPSPRFLGGVRVTWP